MSEQLELEGTILCITEDAFEKFQASSMYEERECITLPSSGPTQSAESNGGEDNKVTCSDDVVVALVLDGVNEEVNTEHKSESENPPKVKSAKTFDDDVINSLPSDDVNSTNQTLINRKKRGRKKKTVPGSSDPVSDNDNEGVSMLDYSNGPSESIEDIQNFIQNTSPTYTPNRRGRRPKSTNTSSDDLSPSKRRLSQESITESLKELGNPENVLPRGRGRPRKLRPSWSEVENSAVNNVSSSHADEAPSIDLTEQDPSNNTSDKSKQILKKRGRPRKTSIQEQQINVEIVDTTDEQFDDLKSLPDVSKGLLSTKRACKRGRPRKPRNSEIGQTKKEKNEVPIVSPLKVSSNSDDDDLSLSNLSKLVHKNQDVDTPPVNEQHEHGVNGNLENNQNNETKCSDAIEEKDLLRQHHSESLPLSKKQAEQNSHGNAIHEESKKQDESQSTFNNTFDTEKVTPKKKNDSPNTEIIDVLPDNKNSKDDKNEQLQSPPKRNPKVPIMSDFEYNIDSIVNENIQSEKIDSPKTDTNSLLVEDVSKRPTRKKGRQTIQYHDESDEDPFANIELSDDEPIMRRKGRRYNSDDEYFPIEKKDSMTPCSSDSESNPDLDCDKKSRKRKYSKKSDSQSPKKRGRKSHLEKAAEIEKPTDKRFNMLKDSELVNDDDDDCIETSDINANDDTAKPTNNETDLASILAKKIQGTNLKIKKVSSTENADKIPPLEIPIIDPNEPKKIVEQSAQTNIITTNNVDTQTGCPYHFPMKDNVALTKEQSKKACEFLNSIVATTADLGKLMTQKSEDFIKKKINTENVTNSVKMDYCVKKSFLLFKLAKNNLEQMEKDLATQYEQFLSKHDLLKYREEPITISPKVKDSDSDCEIVEEPVPEKQPGKSAPKFNPKTVFLNKELSIKIAKKTDDRNINIKKHTVWINDSVMVKKVKPTQSFLAQDSRNKKPPDQNYITTKMVSDFFEDYYRKKSLATCALFTSPNWLNMKNEYVCHYFVVTNDFPINNNIETEDYHMNNASSSTSTPNGSQNLDSVINKFNRCERPSPETLLTLCTEILQKHLPITKSQLNTYCNSIPHNAAVNKTSKKPTSLIDLCINIFSQVMSAYQNDPSCKNDIHAVLSLKTLCYLKVSELLFSSAQPNYMVQKIKYNNPESNIDDEYNIYHGQHEQKMKTLLTLCLDCIHTAKQTPNKCITHPVIKKNERKIKSLFSLCVEFFSTNSISNNNCIICPSIKQNGRDMKGLVSLCFEPTRQGIHNLDKYIVNPTIMSSSEKDNSTVSLCAESELIDNINEQIPNIAPEGAIKSLFSLCLEFISLKISSTNKYTICPELEQHRNEIKSLFSLAFDCVRQGIVNSDKSIENPAIKSHKKNPKSLLSLCVESINVGKYGVSEHIPHSMVKRRKKPIKSLLSLCVEYIQRIQTSDTASLQRTPNSLKHICFNIIHKLLYNNDIHGFAMRNNPVTHETLFINNELAESFTINSVNTLSEEAFHNLQNTVDDDYDDYDNRDTYFNNDDFVSTYEDTEQQNHTEENDWAAQVRMKELKSCANINNAIDTNSEELENFNIKIKTEPVDYVHENEQESPISVKIEPIHGLDEMTMIPEIVVTKTERPVDAQVTENFHNCADTAIRTYSVDTFEEFVRRNKLIQALNEDSYNEVYTQSSFRIRQQYEPDYDVQNDAQDGLLVPHAYTNIYSAKDCLMASSSDEGNSSKTVAKKKTSKRKAKQKKITNSTINTASKDTPNKDTQIPAKEKSSPKTNEVDELTKKMKDRIRQEEIDKPSSDSEYEELPLSVRRKKIGTKEDSKQLDPKPNNEAIQCNDVDSTEQLNNVQEPVISNDETTNSSSSNSVVQNELSKSRVDKKSKRKKRSDTTVEFNGPMELLECEPIIQEYDADTNGSAKERNHELVPEGDIVNDDASKEDTADVGFHDRYGWSCYAIDTKDSKLYQDTSVVLEKLPESFVQTYFQYQEIGEKNQVDREIDRLTNVNSLNRISKEKMNNKPRKVALQVENNKPIQTETHAPSSPECDDSNASELFHELAPSDDEEDNVEDEVPAVIPMRHGENNIAKNSLMNDESEPEDDVKQDTEEEAPVKRRPGPKSKTKVEGSKIPDSELILTADKMMKEELTLLHAPVILEDPVVKTELAAKEDSSKIRKAIPRKVKQHVKSEEDSSSEEEKQWVTTKEKLLKKMKNKEDASLSDAKRAKMVSEFIEKRGVGSESRKVTRVKGRGSRKKFLEREKQLKVLSQELYGESSSDAAHPRKSYFSSNYNGRRNIRKVIDKKSLKQSTVKAIMEEFERKRRLNDRQNRLREHLGCDENVNVLVINDEVCLEYDFEEDRPIVTVHQFFTKVMKAHQYEGVKFMWDACFESVSRVAAGQGGAGCILAHCMGLGKTLQVLALLHTVLTHPGVNMKRVLVCCPLSTVLNWVDEIHKWIGPVTDQLRVFELSKLKKTYERAYQLEDWYNGGGIFIIGYELFRSLTTLDPTLDDVRPTIVNKIRTALLDPGPDIVVCDEGHLLKNDCSVLAVAMSRVATRRRIVLTGTPMQNNLREYYCMVNFIKPNLLGSYAEYSNRFANPIMNGQHRDSSEEDIRLMKTRTHILHKVLEGCLQRQEASVLYPYLPKKHEYTVFIPLTKCQWDLYKHYLYTYCKKIKQGILKDFHILQKIWTHPQVLHNFQTQLSHYKKAKEEKLEDDLAHEDLAADDIKPSDTEVWWLQHLDDGAMLDSLESSNKFVAVFRILKECVDLGDKVLIFSTSLFCLDSLEFFLKQINKWSLGQEYYRLDGSVPAEVRHKWCREFNAENNEKTKLFLISTRAGCLGLNMTAANRVIILDTSWNPAHDIQSIFRVYRFGQKKDCFIYRLVAMGTMEQKIYERSVTKQAVACRVVDEQQIDRHYNSADLAELYRLDEAGGSVAGGVAAGVRDVALLRVARDGPVHAVHEHDSLLRASEPALPEHERAAAWHQFQLERAAEQNDNEPSAKKAKITTKSIRIPKEKPNTEAETPSPEPGPSKPVKEEANPSKPLNATFSAESAFKNYIVDRVVNNLIQHGLPNMQNMKDTSDIVKIVRHIVSNVPANEENKDRVSLVITENLLKHIKVSIPNMQNSLHKNSNENENAAANTTEKRQKPISLPQKQSKRLKEKQMQLRGGNLSKETENEDQNDIVELEEIPVSEKEIPAANLKLENAKSKLKTPESQEIEVPTINLDVRPTNSKERKTNISNEKEVPVQNLDLENTSPRQKKTYKVYKKAIPTVNLVLDDSSNEQKKTYTGRTTETLRVNQDLESNIQSRKTDTTRKETTSVVQQIPDDESYEIVTSNEVEIELVEETPHETPEPQKKIKNIETKRKKPERKVEQPVVTDNSILLSDDDEVCVVQSSEPAASQSQSGPKKRGRGKRSQITPPTETVQPVVPDPVPLHPSLLSNKNFIKIVAYRYLDDNPMLDEHAATLAARYSTLKARREIQYTGKTITSGPLYDIAVKVLGIQTLKKLYHVNNKVSSFKTIVEVEAALRLEESVYDLGRGIEAKQKDVASTASPGPSTAHSKSKSPGKVEKKSVTLAPAAGTNVVPVELFKGPSLPGSSRYSQQEPEESILPDDDSQRSRNQDESVDSVSAEASAKLLQNQKTNPILVQRLLSVKSLPPIVSKTPTDTQNISTTASNIDPAKSDMTICLDSDDEDSPPPPATAASIDPVPVALTSVAAQAIPITSVTAGSHASTSQSPKLQAFYNVTAKADGNTLQLQQRKPLILRIRSKYQPPSVGTEGTSKSDTLTLDNKKITLLYPSVMAKQDPSNTSEGLLKPHITTTETVKHDATSGARRITQVQLKSAKSSSSFTKVDIEKTLSHVNSSRKITKTPQEVKASYGFNKTTGILGFIDPRASTSTQSIPLSSILAKKKALLEGASTSTSNTDKIAFQEPARLKVDSQKTKEMKSSRSSFFDKGNSTLMIDLTSSSSPIRPKRDTAKRNYRESPENCIIVENPPAPAAQIKKVREIKEAKTTKSKMSTKPKASDTRQSSSTSVNERKRPSTSTEPETTKKKRFDELTLQDFDIDDLDDIIELE